ncbi:hypothetical protein SMACR_08423 [Sordaria macrospora]|uniref:WGS project CABT00000000 data, contig 2.57 n=2 Tax=Sordaria macrospora TaxID=5147 RepID=F7WA43_SORMK|nr:uncharacterized protein SMAC_08423 [Sordaria macrospora k-hell]KAA8629337.1 hypothetical protein SMACR_08423 [Sordaria macrospora]KAH7625450.1 hypothetical protein B0T09DRAFT_361395 [Sordaria sp. MPI-SDFR-AT-0083]WPJ62575.1 hypothetical protein SMAC4_08423 [Sordaria macrospora]CCC14111.1 unnamed protein product [Sordaria macrospora k-hell]
MSLTVSLIPFGKALSSSASSSKHRERETISDCHQAHQEQTEQHHTTGTACPGPFPHPAQPIAPTTDTAIHAVVTTRFQHQTSRVPGPFPLPAHVVIRPASRQVYVTSTPKPQGLPRP